ncbi:MAG: hypothetical protein WC869_13835 [Phycisphaerae bacterium]|jgi:hypothetical protein
MNDNAGGLLAPARAKVAGVICAVLSLLGAAALVYLMATGGIVPGASIYVGGWVAVLAIMAVAGVQLARGKAPAQQLLLILFLFLAMAAVVTALVVQLWGGDWGPWRASLLLAAAVCVAGGIIAVSLLVWASSAMSRLRYGSYVFVSLAAALTVVVVFNIMAQDTYVRKDVQTLGRYSLSERAKLIVQTVKSPVTLTCVYTAGDEKASAGEYRQPVWELLDDMHELNKNIEVASATTDTAKVRIVSRLRNRLANQAERHNKFLKDFQAKASDLIALLNTERGQWAALNEDSYLAMWGITTEVSRLLDKVRQELEQVRAKVTRELASTGLPDYAALVAEVSQTMDEAYVVLKEESKLIEKISKIPATAAANRKETLKSIDEAAKAANDMNDALAGSDASVAMEKFSDAAKIAAEKARSAGNLLETVAGPDNGSLLSRNRYFRLTIPSGTYQVRTDLAEFFKQFLSQTMQGLATEVEQVRKVTKSEFHSQTVEKIRPSVREIAATVMQAADRSRKAVDQLVKVDPPTAVLLKKVEGVGFKAILDPMREIIEQAGRLPELKNGTLTSDVASDNIVIVESGGKTAVIPFDEVWPQRLAHAEHSADEGQAAQRVFNGDSAIASRLLTATSDPFATVLLTYYALPEDVAGMAPPPEMAPTMLTTLRKRLEELNLEVVDWNLKDPVPAATAGRPQVLLLLSPPPPVPVAENRSVGFTAALMDKVKAAIESGMPAIFLTAYSQPRSMGEAPPADSAYVYNDYLQQAWGLEVLSNFMIIPALPDENQPGRFKVSIERMFYAPLNTFTAQPIGKPLQAQRVLWRGLCPIISTPSSPDDVTIQPVLGVPNTTAWRGTWATRRLRELGAQLNNPDSTISPDFAAGDMAPPLNVVVAAIRKGAATSRPASGPASAAVATSMATTTSAPADLPEKKPSRIVVMTVGASLLDGYLDKRVGQVDARGTLSLADAPRADADLVINSVYWLIGLERLIASGPVQIKPVAMISPTTMTILRVGYLIALPLVVALIGGLVMLIRRR